MILYYYKSLGFRERNAAHYYTLLLDRTRLRKNSQFGKDKTNVLFKELIMAILTTFTLNSKNQ